MSRRRATCKRAVYIRPLGEMNGHWNPYCAFNTNGTSRGADALDGGLPEGVRADLPDHARRPERERAPARAEAARRSRAPIPANPFVQVVWNPQGYGSPDLPGNSAQAYYPGDKYVDMVGDDLYDIRGKAEWPAAERLYKRAPVEAVRVPRMGALGHRRPGVRAADGEVRADAPADEADRVLQRKAGLDLRPCVEAAIARRLQAVHRAAGLERLRLDPTQALLSCVRRELARVDAVFLQHLRVLLVVDLVRQLGERLLHLLALALLLQLADDEALVDMHTAWHIRAMTPENALDRLREICLAYPEAEEAGGVGNPTFKVRGKIFAMRHSLHEVDRWSLWCKAPPGAQPVVVASDPTRFFVPPYVGGKGWIGAYLDVDQDWEELADLIDESYRMTAPKRLVDQLP